MHLNPRKMPFGVHFGASETRQELPGFSVSLLTPTLRAEDVPLHTHDTASFVFVLSGLYISKADGAPPNLREPTLIFNPAGTTHRDSFLLPQGRFLAVSISDEIMRTVRDGAVLAGAATAFSTGGSLLTAFRLTDQCLASRIDSLSTMEALCWELLSYTGGKRLWPNEGGAAAPRPGPRKPKSSCKTLPTALGASRRWRKNSGCILSTSHERFDGHSDAHPPNIGCAVVLEKQWGFSTIGHLHYRSYLSEQASSTRATLRAPFEIVSESLHTRIENIFEDARAGPGSIHTSICPTRKR